MLKKKNFRLVTVISPSTNAVRNLFLFLVVKVTIVTIILLQRLDSDPDWNTHWIRIQNFRSSQDPDPHKTNADPKH
jgi:hypothetical protein